MQALRRLLAPRASVAAGHNLYVAASVHARQPAFYLSGGVADSSEGRFELYALHVILLMHRLKGQGPQAVETAQALSEAWVKNLDLGLREMGVGDLSVGKKMRKLFEAFHGRTKTYDEAIALLPDPVQLRLVIGRTVLEGRDGDHAAALADYVAACVAALAAQPLDEVLKARLAWPNFEEASQSENAR